MNKMKKLAFAVIAVAGMSGCASTRIAELAGANVPVANAVEPQVLRPVQSYGTMGGYRYRRFAAVAAAS